MAKLYKEVAKQIGFGTFSCPNCYTKIEGSSSCPKCGLNVPTPNQFEFGLLGAPNDIIELFKACDSCGKDSHDEIVKLRDEAYAWRNGKELSEYVKTGSKKVLHLRSDGDIEERKEVQGYTNKWTEKRPERAEKLLRKAITLGDAKAMILLADLYASDELEGPTQNNAPVVLALLSKSAMMGNSDAMKEIMLGGLNLSKIKAWSKCENALPVFEKGMVLGLTWAKYCYAYFGCFAGQLGRAKDYAKAKTLMREAAKTDIIISRYAKRHIGMCLFDGVGGYKSNVDAALSWFGGSGKASPSLKLLLKRTDLCLDDGTLDEKQFLLLVRQASKKYAEAKGVKWIRIVDKDPDGYWVRIGSEKKFGAFAAFKSNVSRGSNFGCNNICFVSNIYQKNNHDHDGKFGGCHSLEFSIRDLLWRDGYDHDITQQITYMKNKTWGGTYGAWDFSKTGFSEEEFVDYLEYVRRYVWTDRKEGVVLYDGSLQTEIVARNADIPLIWERKATGAVNQKHGKTGGKSTDSPKRVCNSQKKRVKFILIGLLFGVFGMHFLYARRKGWFFAYWLMLLANVAQTKVPAMADAIGKTPYFGLVAGLMLVGSIFFMKKDGDGNRM